MILKHFKLSEMENDRKFIYESRAGKFSKICRFWSHHRSRPLKMFLFFFC